MQLPPLGPPSLLAADCIICQRGSSSSSSIVLQSSLFVVRHNSTVYLTPLLCKTLVPVLIIAFLIAVNQDRCVHREHVKNNANVNAVIARISGNLAWNRISWIVVSQQPNVTTTEEVKLRMSHVQARASQLMSQHRPMVSKLESALPKITKAYKN